MNPSIGPEPDFPYSFGPMRGRGVRPARAGGKARAPIRRSPDENPPLARWGVEIALPILLVAITVPGVFAGGDAVRGPDLVVTALRDGRRAAEAIDRYLRRQLEEVIGPDEE